MAKVIWTEPALSDLDRIADYIALDNPDAAKALVKQVFKYIALLKNHPKKGSITPELRPLKTYRQIIEPPCRIFYRIRGKEVFILHIMRSAQLLRRGKLKRKL